MYKYGTAAKSGKNFFPKTAVSLPDRICLKRETEKEKKYKMANPGKRIVGLFCRDVIG